MAEILDEFLSTCDDYGYHDGPMDATLGDRLEWQLVPGLCLRAGSRATLPTADLARRVGVAVSGEDLTASYWGPGVWSQLAGGGEVASATSASTRKKLRWRRSHPPLVSRLRFRPHLVPARLLSATGPCVPDPRGPEPTNTPPASRGRYLRGAKRGPGALSTKPAHVQEGTSGRFEESNTLSPGKAETIQEFGPRRRSTRTRRVRKKTECLGESDFTFHLQFIYIYVYI
jgi:hypothetical protein